MWLEITKPGSRDTARDSTAWSHPQHRKHVFGSLRHTQEESVPFSAGLVNWFLGWGQKKKGMVSHGDGVTKKFPKTPMGG
jgi:hypothetical protein